MQGRGAGYACPMAQPSSRWMVALGMVLAAAASVAACSGGPGEATTKGAGGTSSKSGSAGTSSMSTTGPGGGTAGGIGFAGGLSGTGGAAQQMLDVAPTALQTITVAAGAMTPTVPYAATDSGSPVNATWSVDRVDIASAPLAATPSGTITPTGNVGGLVTVTASYMNQTVTRQVEVKLTDGTPQNGRRPPRESGQVVPPAPPRTPPTSWGAAASAASAARGSGPPSATSPPP